MGFRVRAFQQNGQPTEVLDPFLRSLDEGSDQGTFLSQDEIDRQIAARSAASGARETAGTTVSNLMRALSGREAAQNPVQGPAVIPSPEYRFANRAEDEFLRPFFEDQAERSGLASNAEFLDERINRLSAPLNSYVNGIPRTVQNLYDILEEDGPEAADAYFEGLQRKRVQIQDLTGQRDELLSTLDALDRDGISPTQALRDFIDDSPGLPNINPERESPEDVVELFTQAVTARIADTPEDERYDSGLRGQVGENVDRYYTLLNQNKISVTADGVTADFDRFESIDDYADFFTLDLRMFPPETGITAPSIAERLKAVPGLQEQYTNQQLELLVATLLDRTENDMDLSQQSALSEWLGIQSTFLVGSGE